MHDEMPPVSSAPARRTLAVVLVILVLVISAFAYSIHERNIAKRLTGENMQAAAALKDTRAQLDAITARLNTMTVTAPAVEAPAKSKPSPAHVAERRSPPRRRAEDPRWKQVKAQLAAHQQEIDSTKQELASSRTELQGSIARTHDELVVLERKGQRNYYEFDIDKSKQFQHQGPVGLRLRKANTKNQYADLELMVDDVKLTKKHVNLLEPVTFYAAENGQPVELVINNITKNHIRGYVSEPKYKAAELAAMGGSTDTSSAQQTPPSPRRKLEVPK